MIKLAKTAKPDILKKNEVVWKDALLAVIAAGKKPTPSQATKYRHPHVKAALVAETMEKCAYCESKFLHVHHGDVEHIFPKSLDPAKAFEWDNLTLACEICNQNKSNNDPFLNHIIDPYVADPKDHLTFLGPFLVDLGTPAGISTKILLDLGRPALVERRKEQMEKVVSVINQARRTDLPIAARKAIYADLVATECSQNGQYSAMNYCLVEQLGATLPADVKA